jgi:hypothetical protein
MASLGQNGVIQVVPPSVLDAQEQQQASMQAQATASAQQAVQPDVTSLVSYIKGQFEIFRNHRNTQSGWSERLLIALRAFNGQYDETKLHQIRQFGGSEVYMRMVAQKCRAASSLLRDIYLGPDRPWALKPPDDPKVPEEIKQKIAQLIQQEGQMIQNTLGQPPKPQDLQKRKQALMTSAMDAAKKKAADQARTSEDKIDEVLREGGFYHALAEFLVDLPIFPFACIKGPVVRIIPTLSWPPGGGQPEVKMKPTLTWERVSPFDLWWTPGVASIENANIIEKKQVTRAELNELLGMPGYNQDEIQAVLDEYGRGGLYDNWDMTDAERAVLESRENPVWNRSGMLSMMEFNGNVQGRVLQDYGLAVPDELRDYHVQVWCIGAHVIKAQLSPSPRMRHPYFITSFEKVPGTPVGNGLTDLLTDIQEASNATLRSLINNLSIASGPQVVIDDDQIDPSENTEQLFPWKRWHARKNVLAGSGPNGRKPIEFFQPNDNSEKHIKVLEYLTGIADDVSAIPKYVGGSAGGNAGRTASGLAMLMGNASKILQTVSANIDREVMEPALLQLFDLILLTDTSGLLTGEEKVSVQGVNVSIQRETQRQRQIEFLQATANPVDQKIVGLKGRGVVLRSVASTIGLNGEELVPDDEKLDKLQQDEKESSQNASTVQAVNKGVDAGVKAGVQRITTEITSGLLAQDERMPLGPATHIGTPPGAGGPVAPGGPTQAQPNGAPQGKGGPGDPAAPQGPPQNSAHAAARAQGSQPSQISTGHMGPQTSLAGNAKGPGAIPVQGGAG